ncbi:MAG TPA: hypothetical protein VFU46_00895 [Gemmatimonadales bacterium]|nr:hypothetical protein [Gemmatimonadales bacterium]
MALDLSRVLQPRGRRARSRLAALAAGALGLLAIAALVRRVRLRAVRRERRRALLAFPESAIIPPAPAAASEPVLEDLRHNPRPVAAEEAERILGLAPGQLTALKLPVTRDVDGREIYDSWEVVHWLDLKRTDPAAFEERVGAARDGSPAL